MKTLWYGVLFSVFLCFSARTIQTMAAGEAMGNACSVGLIGIRRSAKTYRLRADNLVEVHWTLDLQFQAESEVAGVSDGVKRVCLNLTDYETDRLVSFTAVRERGGSGKSSDGKGVRHSGTLKIRAFNTSSGYPGHFMVLRCPDDAACNEAQALNIFAGESSRNKPLKLELSYLLVRGVCPLAHVRALDESFNQTKSKPRDALVQRYRFRLESMLVKSLYPVQEQRLQIQKVASPSGFRARLVGSPEGLEPASIRIAPGDIEKAASKDSEFDFEVRYGPFTDADHSMLEAAHVDLAFDAPSGLEPSDIALSAMALAGTFRALKAKRVLAVSHRGHIQVTETMTLLNDYPAAKEGTWSRLDLLVALQQNPFATRTIQEFFAVVPANARNFFYRDITGNISTSGFHSLSRLLAPFEQYKRWQTPEGKRTVAALGAKRNTHQVLGLRPRFPLAPSWRTNIEFGFEVPVRAGDIWKYLGGGTFRLHQALTPPLHGLVIDDLDLWVVLPNAAVVLDIQIPDDQQLYTLSIEHWKGYGYLDFVPRTVVHVRRRNLVTDLSPQTDSYLEITYRVHAFYALWLKPLIFVGYLIIAVVLLALIPRLHLRIRKI
jgi:hypothetical protein